MKRLPPSTLAALLLLAGAARAEEPPPPPDGGSKPAAPAEKPPHSETKVSPEAKDLLDATGKLLYSAVRSGLKEASGTIKMKMDMGEAGGGEGMPEMGADFKVTFKAPDTIKVKGSGGEMFGPGAAEGMAQGVEMLVRNSLGIFDLASMGEDGAVHEAEVRTADGKKVLVVVFYEKGVEQGRAEFAYDDRGLPATAVVTQTQVGPTGMPQTFRTTMAFTYAREGDLHRMEKCRLVTPMAPGPIEYVLTYGEAAGFKVVTSFTMEIQGMGMKFDYRWTDLTVNGSKVDLAAPKPEPKPAATDAGPAPEDDGDADGDEEDEGEDGDDGM